MILVDGFESETIQVMDRGLQYGDGLFETMAVYNGVPQHWTRHMVRLKAGCEALGIAFPDEAMLESEALQLCADLKQSVLKLVITRGVSGRGYKTAETTMGTRIMTLHNWPVYPDSHHKAGIAARLCTMRLGINPTLAGIKHLNRLEQIMARREWSDDAIVEGILCDSDGHVIEGISSNIFIVTQGQLITPLLNGCGVKGVMREIVMEQARTLSIPVQEAVVTLDQLLNAEEVFVCNSLVGIWPIINLADIKGPSIKLTDRQYKIGAITEKLMSRSITRSL